MFVLNDGCRQRVCIQCLARIAAIVALSFSGGLSVAEEGEETWNPTWTTLEMQKGESVAKAEFAKQDDRSVLISGKLDKDTQTFFFHTDLKNITGLRFEVLPDDRLPVKGPGLASNGNFVLSELDLAVAPKNDPENFKAIKLLRPVADFSQGGLHVGGTVDGNPNTGWAIGNEFGKRHFVTYETQEDSGGPEGAIVRVTAHYNFGWGHVLGKFRVSVTDSPRLPPFDYTPPRIADWPTARHDARRSGYSASSIDAATLGAAWHWKSNHPPQPAWAGPAREDAFAKVGDLPSMRSYDEVFPVIGVGDSVFFGSSADDTVYCLDAKTGQEKWSYVTDGPVRVAPTYAEGLVYVGSDDGYAYCLDGATGELVWKFNSLPQAKKILNNGRLISLWPCRTGVLIEGGVAYFAKSMLPWEPSYLCAVDARTGKSDGKSGYVQELEGMTLEGALAASKKALVSPQGRVAPHLFRRKDGKSLGPLQHSGGGTVVVLAMDETIFHGPAATNARAGGINATLPTTRDRIAAFDQGKDIVIAGRKAFMITRNQQLVASDWLKQTVSWKVPCPQQHSLIVVGDTIFAGGEDEVAAYAAEDGRLIWKHAVDGKVYGMAAAAGRLLASTDTGTIYSFEPGKSRWSAAEPKAAEASPTKTDPDLELATGPWLQFVAQGEAVIQWRTAEAVPTMLDYKLGDDAKPTRVEDAKPKKEHRVTLTDLKRNRMYTYVVRQPVDGRLASTREFECDTFFDYNALPAPELPSPYAVDTATVDYGRAAEQILSQSGVKQGICVVLGCDEGRLAYELARRSGLRVIGLESDAAKVASARSALKQAGLYGGRVAIYQVANDSQLDRIPGEFANLLVSDHMLTTGELPGSAEQIVRLLKPGRGVAMLGDTSGEAGSQRKARIERLTVDAGGAKARLRGDGNLWAEITRDRLPGAAEWSHVYGDADNAAFAGEQLGGAKISNDLEVQWLGRPGPRYQADRSGRKPPPLSTNGRLFLQGMHRIVALDSHNGTVLWSLEVPDFERFNIPRDSSNWCADQDHVYAAMRERCWRIDAETGGKIQFYDVQSPDEKAYDWGFVSVQGDQIIGTAVRKGTSWTDFSGGEGWYDHTAGPHAAKICSDNLFAIDLDSKSPNWTYAKGLILNPTITIAEGRVYFIETHSPQAKELDPRRLERPEDWKDLSLVCLDLASGAQVWERPIEPAPGLSAFYLAHSDGRLVLVSSKDNVYHTYVFDAKDGKDVWQKDVAWLSNNHGGHMSRPAIVDGTVYVRPHAMKLSDGEVLPVKVPGGGCGTYACSANALFFRSGTVTVWDRDGGGTTTWQRLRPDCWLSTIPAGGMLLSPEGGGGCSCGTWMETSIVFKPKGLQGEKEATN